MAGAQISSTHPPLPPTTEDDRFNRLRLLRSRRVGPSTYHRLIAEHGSARAALAALPDVAAAAGVTDYQICASARVEAELTAGDRAGARLLLAGTPDYPAALADLPDAPPVLWAIGDTSLLKRPLVALVGARNASSLGTRMARALAEGLGEAGIVVVSGLARGVDTVAHLAALRTGTIAVQAGGVDVVYPAENADLTDQIGQVGLRLSEQPMGLKPQARHFPARNRIISGLSQAVIVVEAAARSGSLITARTALDQGREVMAVPGHPFDGRAAGCNILLRDGALLVRGPKDVMDALDTLPGLHQPAVRKPIEPAAHQPRDLPQAVPRPKAQTAALHTRILDQLGPSPVAEDQLLRDLNAEATEVSPILLDLELEGAIRRDPGGLLAKVD